MGEWSGQSKLTLSWFDTMHRFRLHLFSCIQREDHTDKHTSVQLPKTAYNRPKQAR